MRFVYRVDESRLPLAIFESPGALPVAEIDTDSFYAELARILRKRQLFATLHDIRGMRPDAARRRRFAQWVKENEAELRQRLAAHAVVVDSGIQRGTITAILWFTSSPCPMKVFDDREQAERWLLAEVERRRR
jgi:hypothetical protein